MDPYEYVINLTKKQFTKNEYKLLNKNLNYIPNPGKPNKEISTMTRIISIDALYLEPTSATVNQRCTKDIPTKIPTGPQKRYITQSKHL